MKTHMHSSHQTTFLQETNVHFWTTVTVRYDVQERECEGGSDKEWTCLQMRVLNYDQIALFSPSFFCVLLGVSSPAWLQSQSQQVDHERRESTWTIREAGAKRRRSNGVPSSLSLLHSMDDETGEWEWERERTSDRACMYMLCLYARRSKKREWIDVNYEFRIPFLSNNRQNHSLSLLTTGSLSPVPSILTEWVDRNDCFAIACNWFFLLLSSSWTTCVLREGRSDFSPFDSRITRFSLSFLFVSLRELLVAANASSTRAVVKHPDTRCVIPVAFSLHPYHSWWIWALKQTTQGPDIIHTKQPDFQSPGLNGRTIIFFRILSPKPHKDTRSQTQVTPARAESAICSRWSDEMAIRENKILLRPAFQWRDCLFSR